MKKKKKKLKRNESKKSFKRASPLAPASVMGNHVDNGVSQVEFGPFRSRDLRADGTLSK